MDSKNSKKWILRYSNKYKMLWDLLIISCAIVNCLTIPFEVAWRPRNFQNAGYYFYDYFSDLLFLIDIILSFFTTQVNKHGEEIDHPLEIRKNYILSVRFIADILSISELHLIFNNYLELKYFQLLRVNSFLRLQTLLRQMSWKEELKAIIKLLWFFFEYLIYLHITGCIFYYLITVNNEWIPPLDYYNYQESSIFGQEIDHQYLLMIYYMIACIGGNELGPKNPIECGYIVVLMIAASIL